MSNNHTQDRTLDNRNVSSPDMPPKADAAAIALAAALVARDASGMAGEAWQTAQCDAFATVLFGLASAVAAAHRESHLGVAAAAKEPADAPGAATKQEATQADDAPDSAVDPVELTAATLRACLRLGWRDAQSTAEAIASALVSDPPHEAVQALVKCGWLAGLAWLGGDRAEFEARVVQATASDGFASGRPLLR